MRKPKKRCEICHEWYEPDARTRQHQRSCGKAECRKQRKARANKSWRIRNHGYGRSRRLKMRDWAKGYPDYWQEYRQEHPEYRIRERQRMQANRDRAQNVAKQDAIGDLFVEKLKSIQCDEPTNVAKQDVMDRRLNRLIDCLVWKAHVAKQDAMVFVSGAEP